MEIEAITNFCLLNTIKLVTKVFDNLSRVVYLLILIADLRRYLISWIFWQNEFRSEEFIQSLQWNSSPHHTQIG